MKREMSSSSRKMVMTVATCRITSVSKSCEDSVKGEDTMAIILPLLLNTGAYKA